MSKKILDVLKQIEGRVLFVPLEDDHSDDIIIGGKHFTHQDLFRDIF